MLRDEYLRRLIDHANVQLYLSANDGARIYWPWRMQPPKNACKSYRNACERYIIDSDPLDDSVTTTDVLNSAHKLKAEVASLQDVYHDKDATVDSLLHGFEIADDHAFDGDLLLPLQQPYVYCYEELGRPSNHLIGLGGLKDAPNRERIKAARQLRNHVGPDVWLHGFGWGPTGELARAIRNDGTLLDSLDYSTPVQSVDYSLSTSGDERMSVTAAYAGARLVRDLREVSTHTEQPEPKDLRDKGQSGLDMIKQ